MRMSFPGCGPTRAALSDLLDGELEPGTRRRVTRHLLWCPNCRRMYENLRRTVDGLRRLGEERLA